MQEETLHFWDCNKSACRHIYFLKKESRERFWLIPVQTFSLSGPRKDVYLFITDAE